MFSQNPQSGCQFISMFLMKRNQFFQHINNGLSLFFFSKMPGQNSQIAQSMQVIGIDLQHMLD